MLLAASACVVDAPAPLDATGGDGGFEVVFIDGGERFVDGGILQIDGGVVLLDGGVETVDGGIRVRDGGVASIDGGVVPVDGGVVHIDGGPQPPANMVFIPGGPFTEGCTGGQHAYCDAGLQARTTTVAGFYIDRTEVTAHEYNACVDAGACAPALPGPIGCAATRDAGPNEPAVCVDWFGARQFCVQWRGGRLPTESEWEKAARGSGDSRAFPWGDTNPTCGLAAHIGCPLDAGAGPQAVGTRPLGASPYGVLDMAGNVWEFVDSPPDAGAHIRRGGSIAQGPARLTVFRRDLYPYDRAGTQFNGFRCAWP